MVPLRNPHAKPNFSCGPPSATTSDVHALLFAQFPPALFEPFQLVPALQLSSQDTSCTVRIQSRCLGCEASSPLRRLAVAHAFAIAFSHVEHAAPSRLFHRGEDCSEISAVVVGYGICLKEAETVEWEAIVDHCQCVVFETGWIPPK